MIKMWKTGGVCYVSIGSVKHGATTFKRAFEAHGVVVI